MPTRRAEASSLHNPYQGSSTHTPSTVVPVPSSNSIGDLAQLEGQFSREEISNIVCFIYDKVVMGFENIEVASMFEWCLY